MGDLSSLSHYVNLVVPVRVYRMSSLHLIALDIATTKCPSHTDLQRSCHRRQNTSPYFAMSIREASS